MRDCQLPQRLNLEILFVRLDPLNANIRDVYVLQSSAMNIVASLFAAAP
jgi:hypothetical protein